MELTVAQYLVLMLAGTLYGFTKTGITGTSTVLVPLMLCVFTPGQSLGIALPMLIFADVFTLFLLRRSVSWRIVFQAILWSLLGLIAGWRVLVYAQSLPDGAGDPLLRRIIGCIMVFVVVSGIAMRVVRSRQNNGVPPSVADDAPPPPWSFRYVFASFVAMFGGGISMLANNSGPAWVVYLMLFRLDKYFFLGTAAWLFAIQNIAKLPFVVQLGYVGVDTLHVNLYMIPFTLFGLALGRWVVGRVSQRLFDNVVQVVALLGALYVLFWL